MSEQRNITEITRRRIFDQFCVEQLSWSGRLDEVEFLRRLYDVDSLPSGDRRYTNAAGDIAQHILFNDDWDYDWVFFDSRFRLNDGPDSVLLAFLAEMLHPVVRPNREEVDRLLFDLNEALRADGYELVQNGAISGFPTFVGRKRGSFHGNLPKLRLDERPLLTRPHVLREHLGRIGHSIERDPAAAIGSCKELVESLCKLILEGAATEYPSGDDLPALYRKVADLLRLKAESVPSSVKGSETSQRILRTLVTTIQSLAELRNELGLGHGRSEPSPALRRHARLALNSTITVSEFLLDTWQARVDNGTLTAP